MLVVAAALVAPKGQELGLLTTGLGLVMVLAAEPAAGVWVSGGHGGFPHHKVLPPRSKPLWDALHPVLSCVLLHCPLSLHRLELLWIELISSCPDQRLLTSSIGSIFFSLWVPPLVISAAVSY